MRLTLSRPALSPLLSRCCTKRASYTTNITLFRPLMSQDTPALSSVPPTAMRSGGVKYPWRTPGAAAAPGARASPLGTSPVAPAPLAPTPRAIQMPPVTPATAPLAEKHAMVEVGLQTTPGLGLIAANREGQAGVIASLSPVDGGAARSPAAAVAPSPARLPIPDERLLEGAPPHCSPCIPPSRLAAPRQSG